jgi:hypothetical protein
VWFTALLVASLFGSDRPGSCISQSEVQTVIDYNRTLGWTGVGSNRKNAHSETDAVTEIARLKQLVELQKNELARLRRLLGHDLQLQ